MNPIITKIHIPFNIIIPVPLSWNRLKINLIKYPVNWANLEYFIIRNETNEMPNFNDYLNLLILNHLIIRRKKFFKDTVYNIETHRPNKIIKFICGKSKFLKTKGYFFKLGSKTFTDLENSFYRLTNTYWAFKFSSHKEFVIKKPIYDFYIEQGKLAFILRTNYVNLLIKKKSKYTLYLNLSHLSTCKTVIGRALLYWLSFQKNNTFSFISLKNVLHYADKSDKYLKKQLTKALQDILLNTSLLEDFYFSKTSLKIKRY